MSRLCMLVVVATLVATLEAAAAGARQARQAVPSPTIFAPPPPDLEDGIVPPPVPEDSTPIKPPLPPIRPPPPPPPPPPPTPALSHSEFEVMVAPFAPANLDDASAFSAAPAPSLVLAAVPRPRFVPFADYGPPTAARQLDEPLREFLETSSEWGGPGALSPAIANTRRGSPKGGSRRNFLGGARSQEAANQEFLETSSEWGGPGALSPAIANIRRGSPKGGSRRNFLGGARSQEAANQEFLETSSEWGGLGALAPATANARRGQVLRVSNRGLVMVPDEPLQEFNEISSDWGVPSSLLEGSDGERRRANGVRRPPSGQPDARPQQQMQQQVRQNDQPADIEGRFVYSHLQDGLLFTGPLRDSPLDLFSSPAVRLVSGSFSFVSPDGIPVDIRKIRYHSTADAFTEAVRNRGRKPN